MCNVGEGAARQDPGRVPPCGTADGTLHVQQQARKHVVPRLPPEGVPALGVHALLPTKARVQKSAEAVAAAEELVLCEGPATAPRVVPVEPFSLQPDRAENGELQGPVPGLPGRER